jgi:hypothetical protein
LCVYSGPSMRCPKSVRRSGAPDERCLRQREEGDTPPNLPSRQNRVCSCRRGGRSLVCAKTGPNFPWQPPYRGSMSAARGSLPLFAVMLPAAEELRPAHDELELRVRERTADLEKSNSPCKVKSSNANARKIEIQEHRGRGEPRLETRRRLTRAGECVASRQLRAGTNRLHSPAGRNDRSGLHRRDELRDNGGLFAWTSCRS